MGKIDLTLVCLISQKLLHKRRKPVATLLNRDKNGPCGFCTPTPSRPPAEWNAMANKRGSKISSPNLILRWDFSHISIQFMGEIDLKLFCLISQKLDKCFVLNCFPIEWSWKVWLQNSNVVLHKRRNQRRHSSIEIRLGRVVSAHRHQAVRLLSRFAPNGKSNVGQNVRMSTNLILRWDFLYPNSTGKLIWNSSSLSLKSLIYVSS